MSTVKTNNVQIGQSVTATNNFTWYQPATPDGTVRLGNGNSGSVTDRVTVTIAGNVGIGTSSPGTKVDIGSGTLRIKNATGDTSGLLIYQAASDTSTIFNYYSGPLVFGTGNAEKMRLDSSGNLGLGVTPSGSQLPTLQFGSNAIIASSANTYLTANAYYNSGWKYVASSQPARMFSQDSSGFIWYTAPSGTAGNAISFTQAMTLDSSGNLILNVGEYIRITGTTISVGTSATAITGAHSFGSTAIVRGINGGQIFGDLVFFSDSVVTVLASHGVSGGPAARTYTAVGGVLKLAMASGTYSVNVGITTVV